MELVESNILQVDSTSHCIQDLGHSFRAVLNDLRIPEGCRIAVISSEQLCLLESLIGLYRCGRGGLVLPQQRATPDILTLLENEGFTILELALEGSAMNNRRNLKIVQHTSPQESIYLLTSGTTGLPKLFQHSWRSLATQRTDINRKEHRWLLTYTAGTYAWYQMLTMAMFCARQNLIVCSSYQPEDIWNCAYSSSATSSSATAISSTPSFWRYLLLRCSREELSKVALEQISLGGEVVNQAILDELRMLYPTARVSHLYASTEDGVGFVVNDGLAGFPKGWLAERAPGRPLLAVKDGVLWIESPHAASGCEGLFCTRDTVLLEGDRVVVQGRLDSGLLNIGGQKVLVYSVEEVLAKHPDVAWCKVYGKKAPLVGALVVADIVLRGTSATAADAQEMDRILSAHCASSGLAEAAIPRMWRYLDSIPLHSNFKS